MTDESLLDLFRTDLAEARIQDPYQHDLYLQQGIEQLKEFLALCHRREMPEVLHTEEFFEVKVGATTVVGRIDRVDKLPDGRVVITDYKTGKAAFAGGRRREFAALHLRAGCPREVGIPRRAPRLLQPE